MSHVPWQVMADVYASAVGTTVLQLKEIPPRPAEFDGALCLFGLKQGKDEAAIGAALKRFGEIKRIELDRDPAVVRFTTHAAALAAKREALPDLCDGMDTLYNERSYDGRKGVAGREDDYGRGWWAPPSLHTCILRHVHAHPYAHSTPTPICTLIGTHVYTNILSLTTHSRNPCARSHTYSLTRTPMQPHTPARTS